MFVGLSSLLSQLVKESCVPSLAAVLLVWTWSVLRSSLVWTFGNQVMVLHWETCFKRWRMVGRNMSVGEYHFSSSLWWGAAVICFYCHYLHCTPLHDRILSETEPDKSYSIKWFLSGVCLTIMKCKQSWFFVLFFFNTCNHGTKFKEVGSQLIRIWCRFMKIYQRREYVLC